MVAHGSAAPGARRMQIGEARARDALALRLKGYTYVDIGQALDISTEGARQAVQRAMAEVRTESAETAIEVREQEAARLDRMLLQLETLVARCDDDDRALAIQDRMLRIQDRRAKLLGLDLARLEVTGANGGPIQITGIQRVIVDPATTTIDVTPERPALAPPENDARVRDDDASNESKADSGTYDADVVPVTIVR